MCGNSQHNSFYNHSFFFLPSSSLSSLRNCILSSFLKFIVFLTLSFEGVQSTPLRDVSYCHGDCFDRMQVILSHCQKAFYLSFIYLDEFIWAPLPERELLPEITLYIRKIISMALKILFAKHLLFSFLVNRILSHWSLRSLPPSLAQDVM